MTGSTGHDTTRRFAVHTVLYLFPTLVVRGLSFLLTPIYARAMPAADYGLVGLATTLVTLLGTVMGLALYASVGRLYIDCETDQAQRRFLGTLMTALLIAPPVLAAGLDAIGALGFLHNASSLPYSPHLRLVIWTSLFSVYPTLAVAILTIREEPQRLAGLNVGMALAQILATLWLVVVSRQGATGVLWSMFLGNLVGAAVSMWLVGRLSSWRIDLSLLRRALAYSLPLLPHLLSNWAFAVSDRLILDHYATRETVGRYSLAYLFSFAVSMVVGAVISAFGPIAQRTLKAKGGTSPQLRALSALIVGVLTFASLGAVLLGRDAILLLTPTGYHSANEYVALVVLGAFAQGLALVIAQVTWFSERTGLVALVTMLASALNVGLNLWLIPRYGAMAAAATTAACGGALLVLHSALARILMPVDWPYRAWALTICVGLGCAALASLAAGGPLWLKITVDAAGVLVAFPVGLMLLGVTSIAEVRDLLAHGSH